jgi:hypothetical protein
MVSLMKTVLRLLEIAQDAQSEGDILGLISDEADGCIVRGDLLGAGEWLASQLDYATGNDLDAITAKVLALWASTSELSFSPSSIEELLANISAFEPSMLATALISLLARRPQQVLKHPELYRDLAFKISDHIIRIFDLATSSPSELCQHAAKRLNDVFDKTLHAVGVFRSVECIAARNASINVLKSLRQLRPLLLSREQPLLSSLEILLGTGFREFCQSYERSETHKVVLRLPDIRSQARSASSSNLCPENSVLCHQLVKPIAEHLLVLADEAARSCKLALTPSLRLSSNLVKLDLSLDNSPSSVPLRLTNQGVGTAVKVRLESTDVAIVVESPKGNFDLSAGSDRIINVDFPSQLLPYGQTISILWTCEDVSGQKHRFSDSLNIEQQKPQPDWQFLLENPPYTVNPIKTREKLFGRKTQLDGLLFRAAAGTSTFVWGQKRVGKTSLLQVTQEELTHKEKYVCVFLRMGQLAAMHEGQLAYTLASRLISALPGCTVVTPSESDFGAGLGRLIPLIETVSSFFSGWKFVVIIDEFDDLDPSFYTGERGRLFIKALRSLSEIGLTFLFAGSERMKVIYDRHSLELNKWTNLFVDSLESLRDGRDLITKPVEGVLDYEGRAVDGIFELCSGNPFFIHLACLSLFERSVGERRTYISEAAVDSHLTKLAESLGQTNFAHYWEDNPTLDREENHRHAAENCLALCCVGNLRASFQNEEEVWQQQEALSLSSAERLSVREMSSVIQRLRSRKVLSNADSGRIKIAVPLFARWLEKYAELHLLPIWRKYALEKTSRVDPEEGRLSYVTAVAEPQFPISEDELLAVSQNLVFCGKQKDVAEIRSWLRQFDDDNRIEIAFVLLRRLTEKGYVSDGARELAISKITEGIAANRLQLGAGKWNILRARKDNLCLSYVDSELKSGASLTRELNKRIGPGRSGNAEEISTWIKTHSETDSMIVILDDLSATGTTICNGLKRWRGAIKEQVYLEKYLNEGRVMCALLYASGQALDAIHGIDSRIRLFSANLLGPEVRAFDPDSGIFDDPLELEFARDVMIQIGRELTPQTPLGFGDQGMLFTFHNTVPNNTLPVFWSNGRVNEQPWRPSVT